MLGSKRAPLFAGIGVAVVALLVVMVVVLPKMNAVSTAQQDLEQKRSEQQSLLSTKNALTDTKAHAPEYRRQIKDVARQIPPVADEGGIFLLLRNAATSAGLDVATIAPSNPTFDPVTGLSAITVNISATGTYFEITEFMYEIETLPRAAKATDITLSPAVSAGTGTSTVMTLTLTTNVVLYTSDASAGPGSSPGPTTGTGTGG